MALSRITANSIADGTVVAADIADGSITTAKIADANVTSGKIVSVANTQITGNITSSQIQPDVVLQGNVTLGAVTFPNTDGTSGQALTTNGSGIISFASVSSANVQTFDSSGTWTKPATGNFAFIQIWGGGGGGARISGTSGSTSYASGGGGGGYNELFIPLAALGSTVSVTVGAGGVGRTGSNGNGTAGGTSDFGGLVYSTGGGFGRSGNLQPGGIGGSQTLAGGGYLGTLQNVFINGAGTPGQYVGGPCYSLQSPIPGWWNGGGGGVYGDVTGGSSERGGGGGGAAQDALTSSGGSSLRAGSGGNGGRATSGFNGNAPAGGGGGRNNNLDGGNGAAGRVIVYVW